MLVTARYGQAMACMLHSRPAVCSCLLLVSPVDELLKFEAASSTSSAHCFHAYCVQARRTKTSKNGCAGLQLRRHCGDFWRWAHSVL